PGLQPVSGGNRMTEPLALGVMTGLGRDPLESFRKVREMGFPTCQLGNPPEEYVYGPDARALTERVKAAIAETGVRVTAVFIMYPGHVWDLVDGPRTIGLVPADGRGARVVPAWRMATVASAGGFDAGAGPLWFIP